MSRVTLDEILDERVTTPLKLLLTGLDGATGLDATALDTITITHYEETTERVINGCLRRSVKNANGGVLYAAAQTDGAGNVYNVQITLGVADMVVLTGGESESHVALIEYTWTEGGETKYGKAEVEFVVRNLVKV
ncbi:hypothetical protein LLG88_13610 [bacterium]|nr:hypothetical protein [bacterium]